MSERESTHRTPAPCTVVLSLAHSRRHGRTQSLHRRHHYHTLSTFIMHLCLEIFLFLSLICFSLCTGAQPDGAQHVPRVPRGPPPHVRGASVGAGARRALPHHAVVLPRGGRGAGARRRGAGAGAARPGGRAAARRRGVATQGPTCRLPVHATRANTHV